MFLFSLPTEANAGLVGTMRYLGEQLPILFPSILFFVFVVGTVLGYNIDNKRTGRANIWLWLSVNSFIVSFAAVILYLIPGVLDIYTGSVSIAFMILFFVIFIFTIKE